MHRHHLKNNTKMATSSNKFRRVTSNYWPTAWGNARFNFSLTPNTPASTDDNGSETQGGNSDGGKSGKFNWEGFNSILSTLGDTAVGIWGNAPAQQTTTTASGNGGSGSGSKGGNTALYIGIGAGALILVLILTIVLIKR